jgi:hypothetical protein
VKKRTEIDVSKPIGRSMCARIRNLLPMLKQTVIIYCQAMQSKILLEVILER